MTQHHDRASRLRRFASGALASTLLVSAALIAAPTPAIAADAPPDAGEKGQLLVLLDGSGSMNEPDPTAGTKIAAARQAVGKVVAGASADSLVGLRTYAGTSAGGAASCTDTKLRVPIGPVNKAAITSAANGLTPRGDTPIAYSLKQAAKDFKPGTPGTILLVSDGRETCDPDPCAVAKSITAQGLQLRIDVVGLKVDAGARDQLSCIARAGSGTYTDAADGAALGRVLPRQSERALRMWRPSGAPITGQDQPAAAQAVKPGQYVDALPAVASGATTKKWYRLRRPSGGTVWAGASVAPRTTGNEVYSLQVETYPGNNPQSSPCDQAESVSYGISDVPAQAQITAAASAGTAGTEQEHCKAGDTILVAVTVSTAKPPAGTTIPVELSFIGEPAVTNAASLPPTTENLDEVSPLVAAPTGPVAKLPGGSTFGDAPVVPPGQVTDTILPGETLYYRVPVQWGQQLSYRVDLPGNLRGAGASESATGIARAYAFSPTRKQVVDDTDNAKVPYPTDENYDAAKPLRIGGATVPVRYNNRTEIVDSEIEGAALAGYYTIQVHVGPEVKPAGGQPLPFTLGVAVTGQPTGAPTYQNAGYDPLRDQGAGTPAPAANPSPAASGSASTMAIAAISIGVLLAIAGTTTAIVALRRRRRARIGGWHP